MAQNTFNESTSNNSTNNSTALPREDRSGGWGATKLFGATMLILATIGEFFSFLITVDKIALLVDPTFVPACTFNEVVSCSDVMQSPQANAFGFPNPLIGILGYGVVMTIGVVLMTGAKLPRWFWWCTLAGMTFGIVFVHWLAYSAIFVIGALCPYCMAVWAIMMPLLIMTMVHMMREIRRDRGDVVAHSAFGMPLLVVIAWYLGVAAVIWIQLFM
ncbi:MULTISPECIES: vitamin K epoxide reductase family protein [Corynebacterium]|nr:MULTISPECIES: vitamin K epoxide reductase family protein [Corynebacterium]